MKVSAISNHQDAPSSPRHSDSASHCTPAGSDAASALTLERFQPRPASDAEPLPLHSLSPASSRMADSQTALPKVLPRHKRTRQEMRNGAVATVSAYYDMWLQARTAGTMTAETELKMLYAIVQKHQSAFDQKESPVPAKLFDIGKRICELLALQYPKAAGGPNKPGILITYVEDGALRMTLIGYDDLSSVGKAKYASISGRMADWKRLETGLPVMYETLTLPASVGLPPLLDFEVEELMLEPQPRTVAAQLEVQLASHAARISIDYLTRDIGLSHATPGLAGIAGIVGSYLSGPAEAPSTAEVAAYAAVMSDLLLTESLQGRAALHLAQRADTVIDVYHEVWLVCDDEEWEPHRLSLHRIVDLLIQPDRPLRGPRFVLLAMLLLGKIDHEEAHRLSDIHSGTLQLALLRPAPVPENT